MQIDVFKDCLFIFLHIKNHERSENKKNVLLGSPFSPKWPLFQNHKFISRKGNRPDRQFIFTFPLVLSHKVQHIQKLQNSEDKKKTGAGILNTNTNIIIIIINVIISIIINIINSNNCIIIIIIVITIIITIVLSSSSSISIMIFSIFV